MESRLTCDTFTFYYNGVTKKTNFWVKFKAEFWGDNIDLTDLDGDFSEEEIKKAMPDLGTDKAPKPNGNPIFFFHEFWEVVRQDITDLVVQVSSGKAILDKFNYS